MGLLDVFGKIGGVIGKIGSVVGKAAGVASVVIKVAKPLLEAMAPSIPELEKGLNKIEDVVLAAGEEADDFFDRNLPVLLAIEDVAGRGEIIMRELRELAAYCREASQTITPDVIDGDERAEILARIKSLVENARDYAPAQEAAVALLSELEG